MKVIFIFISSLLILTNSNARGFFKKSSKKSKSRKKVPSKIRVIWQSDPSSKAIIAWDNRTKKIKNTILYYDTVDRGNDLKSYRYQIKDFTSIYYKKMRNTFVKLENLKAGTKYFFKIQNKYGTTKRFWFKTAPSTKENISFISGGDSRNNREVRRNANKLVSKLRTDFVIFAGDFTDKGKSSQWKKWFDDWQLTIASDGRVTPIIPARGNHESSNKILSKLFLLPHSNYYSIDIADKLLHLVLLNTEVSIGGDQSDWLKRDLKNGNESDFIMAAYHRPMRPHTRKKKEGVKIYKYWSNLFYKYGVNLAIESDSHTVKQTWPIRPDSSSKSDEGFIRDDKNGTVYIGEGCWGAPLRLSNDSKIWTRSAGSFNQFKWIFIKDQRIEIRTVKIDNSLDVESLKDGEKFIIPKNIKLWKNNGKDYSTIKMRKDD